MRTETRGLTVVEIVVGVAVFGMVIAFILSTSTLFFSTTKEMRQNTKALYLAEAGLEMLQFVRSENWTAFAELPLNTDYYLAIATTSISTTTSPEIIDGEYTRGFRLRAAYRTSSDDWTASTTAGSSVDAESREVVVWVSHHGETVELAGLLTDLHDEE